MPTYTSQPDETSGIDTILWSFDPNGNHGTDIDIGVGEKNDDGSGYKNRTLIKFDLSSIPSNASILSVVLTLTTKLEKSDNARAFRVYRQLKPWTESATWNKYDGTNNWTAAGGFHASDCEQTDVGYVTMPSSAPSNTAIDFVLSTSSVLEMVNGSFTNNGWLIKADTEANDYWSFHSSSATTASYRPKLVIEYLEGEASFTVVIDL